MKLAEIFEVVALLDCIILFLSSRVLRRSLSYSKRVKSRPYRRGNADLGFFLEVEGIDPFKLSFLMQTVSIAGGQLFFKTI